MRKQSKIVAVLQDTSGASFLFVLGVMLLLMAIAVSVLVAASANTGFVLEQHEHSQIMILDESVHKNILYALQRDKKASELYSVLLSTQVAKALYEANDPLLPSSFNPAGLEKIDIDDISVTNLPDITTGDIKIQSVTLSFPDQSVVFTDPIAAINDAGVLTPRKPRTATVDATMIVTVEINARGRTSISRATYVYTGGKMSDDQNGDHEDEEDEDAVFPMEFLDDGVGDDGYGEWRLIRHENMESYEITGP